MGNLQLLVGFGNYKNIPFLGLLTLKVADLYSHLILKKNSDIVSG